jgi:hypothetical protein
VVLLGNSPSGSVLKELIAKATLELCDDIHNNVIKAPRYKHGQEKQISLRKALCW